MNHGIMEYMDYRQGLYLRSFFPETEGYFIDDVRDGMGTPGPGTDPHHLSGIMCYSRRSEKIIASCVTDYSITPVFE
jgi:hypothetical protein